MAVNLRISLTPTAFAVTCSEHGTVYMTDDEYLRQLTNVDRVWECPFPLCGHAVEFDDDNYERANDADFKAWLKKKHHRSKEHPTK